MLSDALDSHKRAMMSQNAFGHAVSARFSVIVVPRKFTKIQNHK
jgi:hypothetical protein